MYRVTYCFSSRRSSARFLLCLCALLGSCIATYADGAPEPRVVHAIDTYPHVLWNESWGGAEAQADSWSIYSGSTVALTGDIEGPGWRLRSTGGYGRYHYAKLLRGLDGPEDTRLTGQKYFSTLLLGHQFQRQRLTIKAFAGLTSDRHIIDPRDPMQSAGGMVYGGKAALEAWLALANAQWLAGNLSWASTLQTYNFSARGGMAVLNDLDFGLEARWQRNRHHRAGRIGGFATWRIGDAGLTAAAGATGQRARPLGPYGRISLFLRF